MSSYIYGVPKGGLEPPLCLSSYSNWLYDWLYPLFLLVWFGFDRKHEKMPDWQPKSSRYTFLTARSMEVRAFMPCSKSVESIAHASELCA
jgi:hypothetical protein